MNWTKDHAPRNHVQQCGRRSEAFQVFPRFLAPCPSLVMTDPRPACGNTLHAEHCIILRPLKLGFRSFYFSANSTIHAFGTVSVWHWKHRKVECNAGCQCTHNAFGNCGKIWFKHTMWEQNVHITYVKMASICTQFVYRLCKIWGQSLFLQKFPGLKPKMVPRRGSDIPR